MNGQVPPPQMGQQQPMAPPMAPQQQVPQQPMVPQQQPMAQPQQQQQKFDPKIGKGLTVEWGYVKKSTNESKYYGYTDSTGQFKYVPELTIKGKWMFEGETHKFSVLGNGIKTFQPNPIKNILYPSWKIFCKPFDLTEAQKIKLENPEQVINLDLSKQAFNVISSLQPNQGDVLILSYGVKLDSNSGAMRPIVNAEIERVQMGQGYAPQPIYPPQPPTMAPQQNMAQMSQNAPYQQQPVNNPQQQTQSSSPNINSNPQAVNPPQNNVGVITPSSLPVSPDEQNYLKDYNNKVYPTQFSPEHFIGCYFLRNCGTEQEIMRLKFLYDKYIGSSREV